MRKCGSIWWWLMMYLNIEYSNIHINTMLPLKSLSREHIYVIATTSTIPMVLIGHILLKCTFYLICHILTEKKNTLDEIAEILHISIYLTLHILCRYIKYTVEVIISHHRPYMLLLKMGVVVVIAYMSPF